MRKRLSREDFEKLSPTRVSRWGEFLDKVAKGNDAHEVPLDRDERNFRGRFKVGQQIRSLATRRGMRIRIRTLKGIMWVQAIEEEG